MLEPRLWVVYVTSEDGLLDPFAEVIVRSGKPWRPLVVNPLRLLDAVQNLKPAAVVMVSNPADDETLIRRTVTLHNRHRLVIDNGRFTAIAALLRNKSARLDLYVPQV